MTAKLVVKSNVTIPITYHLVRYKYANMWRIASACFDSFPTAPNVGELFSTDELIKMGWLPTFPDPNNEDVGDNTPRTDSKIEWRDAEEA